jgi:hypothetical protein
VALYILAEECSINVGFYKGGVELFNFVNWLIF